MTPLFRNPFTLSPLDKATRDLQEARCQLIDAEWQTRNWLARKNALEGQVTYLAKTVRELAEEQASFTQGTSK